MKKLLMYFVKRWKIVPVKERELSLGMTGKSLSTSIFKIGIKISFFWYIVCLVTKNVQYLWKIPTYILVYFENSFS